MIPNYLIQALYHTLISSIGQGLVLAIITGLIILATRKASSRLRYNLLVAALAIFAVWGGITFCSALRQSRVAPLATVPSITMAVEQVAILAATDGHKDAPVLNIITFLNRQAGNIVLLWLIVVCIRSLQLVVGLRGVYRLRHTALVEVDQTWLRYTRQLAVKMGIRQVLYLAESGIAKVPMVVGHLKPLVLIPAGLITALPPAELEAILIHELAHVRRRDYLVNLLQSFMEILFFFNPALWWISSLIRKEREHCCDDIVIGQVSSRKEYIRALVSCEEYYSPETTYALALNRNKNHLMTRVKRILNNSNASLSRLEKYLLVICLIGITLFTIVFSQKANANKAIAVVGTRNTAGNNKPLFEGAHNGMQTGTTTTTKTRQDKISSTVSLVEQLEDIAAVSIVGEEDFPGSVDIKGGEEDYSSAPTKGGSATEHEEIRKQDELARHRAEARRKYDEAQKRMEETHRQQAAIYARQAKKVQDDADRVQAEAKRERVLAIRKQEEAIRKQKEAVLKQHETIRKQNEAVRKQNEIMRRQNEELRKKEHIPVTRQKEDPTHQVVMALIDEGIIKKEASSLTFTLSNESFVVNKVKQPESVFLKFRDKYVNLTGKKGNWKVTYTSKVSH